MAITTFGVVMGKTVNVDDLTFYFTLIHITTHIEFFLYFFFLHGYKVVFLYMIPKKLTKTVL